MLKHLSIRNYALIQELTLEPSGHLNVITGETGAGKSILLGALGLLTGNRADTRVLWDEKEKCITEGTFDLTGYQLQELFAESDLDYEPLTVIRREISPGGKSRAFVNDTPVTLETLRQLGARIIDVHSQHETLELGRQDFQLGLIDAFSGNHTLLLTYRKAYNTYQEAARHLKNLTDQAHQLKAEADFLKFQFEEIEGCHFEPGEQETLEDEQKIIDHSGDIKQRIAEALGTLEGEDSVLSRLGEIVHQLQGITSYASTYETLHQRLVSVRIELDDLTQELSREGEKVEFDPARGEFVQERLGQLYRLLRKHNLRNLDELLKLRDELESKLVLTSNLDDALAQASRACEQAEADLETKALGLSDSRKKAIAPLTKGILEVVSELGMPEARIEITLNPQTYTPSGCDAIDVLFSANKGIAPRTLAAVASGGEFSRLMFAIKYVMAEKTAIPTLVLDEIDTGISGEVAIRLAALMKTMAQRHQIIVITHLPGVAAKGHFHYYVYKNNSKQKTVSEIRLLTPEDRVTEIAKMIGGDSPTPAAYQSARDLLT